MPASTTSSLSTIITKPAQPGPNKCLDCGDGMSFLDMDITPNLVPDNKQKMVDARAASYRAPLCERRRYFSIHCIRTMAAELRSGLFVV